MTSPLLHLIPRGPVSVALFSHAVGRDGVFGAVGDSGGGFGFRDRGAVANVRIIAYGQGVGGRFACGKLSNSRNWVRYETETIEPFRVIGPTYYGEDIRQREVLSCPFISSQGSHVLQPLRWRAAPAPNRRSRAPRRFLARRVRRCASTIVSMFQARPMIARSARISASRIPLVRQVSRYALLISTASVRQAVAVGTIRAAAQRPLAPGPEQALRTRYAAARMGRCVPVTRFARGVA